MKHALPVLLAIIGLAAFMMSATATTPEPHWIRLYDADKMAPEGDNIGDVPNVLEYFPDKTAKPTPAIIICPGGGYQSLQMQEEGENAADWFKAHGIAAFVLPYRIHQPNGPSIHPRPMHDVQRAERWVRSQAAGWNIDPHKIGILGFSAGGHVASTLETHFDAGDPKATDPIERISCRPDFAILVYAVISMKDGITNAVCKKNLLGTNPDPALVQSLSNETQVTAQTPTTILFACADDPLVPIANDRLMVAALQKAGVSVEYHEYPTGGHAWGFNAKPDNSPPGWLDVTLYAWLKKQGIVGGEKKR
jgi:acetyl esterase/lipase